MGRKGGVALSLAAVLVIGLVAVRSAAAAERPVAILVDGFGDCCALRMTTVIDGLKARGVEFPALARQGVEGNRYSDYTVPWNSFTALDQGFQVSLDPQKYVAKALAQQGTGKGSAGLAQGMGDITGNRSLMDSVMNTVRRGTDSAFVDAVSNYLDDLDPDRPVILIGHSFGADSVMKAAAETKHEILLLAAIDPVGSGGLRRLFRDREVPGNVQYFYNRWQNNGMFPFDYRSNGAFEDCKARTCDQRKRGASTGSDSGHVEIPYDPAVQQELLAVVDRLLGRGGDAVTEDRDGGDAVKDKAMEAVKGLFGR